MGTFMEMKVRNKSSVSLTILQSSLNSLRTKSGEEVGMALVKLMTQYGCLVIISGQCVCVCRLEMYNVYSSLHNYIIHIVK